jgi:hypothetical protein
MSTALAGILNLPYVGVELPHCTLSDFVHGSSSFVLKICRSWPNWVVRPSMAETIHAGMWSALSHTLEFFACVTVWPLLTISTAVLPQVDV